MCCERAGLLDRPAWRAPALLTRCLSRASQIQRLECTNSLAANDGQAGAMAQKGSEVTVVGCAASECGAWTCTPLTADQRPLHGALSSVTITCEELQLRNAGAQRVFRAGSCSAIYSAHVAADASDAHAASAHVGVESSSRVSDRDSDRDRKAQVSRGARDAAAGVDGVNAHVVDGVNAHVVAELTALGCGLAVQ